MHYLKFILISIVIYHCFIMPIQAESPFSVSGYYKNFSVVLKPSGAAGLSSSILNYPAMGMVNNRVRMNMFYDVSDRYSVNIAYDISPRIQDQALFNQDILFTGIDPFQYRFDDLDSRLYPAKGKRIRSFAIFQNLDRAFLKARFNFADFYLGRQAIAWGSARVVNPTDIIAPYTFEELDTEDRIGVDAVRMRIPIGFMGEIDFGYVGGKDFEFENSAMFVRGKYYLAKTDVSLLLVEFRENVLAGLDISRAIGGAGFWLESAVVFDNAWNDFDIQKESNYLRATIGMDYSFSGKTYGFLEYHFSSAGSGQPQNYLGIFEESSVSHGAVYLMGEHYLIPGLTYQITPLITLTGQSLFNVNDQSIFITPQVEYNIAENIYISGGAFISIGQRPEVRILGGSIPTLSFHSEFGGYPDMYFTSFRIYF